MCICGARETLNRKSCNVCGDECEEKAGNTKEQDRKHSMKHKQIFYQYHEMGRQLGAL